MFLAADFMHKRGIIHRDFKLANILLTSQNKMNLDLRVVDFGLAT